MVVLIGAHTIGRAHCAEFRDQLLDWQSAKIEDPNMNASLVAKLRRIRPDRSFTFPALCRCFTICYPDSTALRLCYQQGTCGSSNFPCRSIWVQRIKLLIQISMPEVNTW